MERTSAERGLGRRVVDAFLGAGSGSIENHYRPLVSGNALVFRRAAGAPRPDRSAKVLTDPGRERIVLVNRFA